MYSSGVPPVSAGTPTGVFDVPLSAAAYAVVTVLAVNGVACGARYICVLTPLTAGTFCTLAPAGIVTIEEFVADELSATGTVDEALPPLPPPPHATSATQMNASRIDGAFNFRKTVKG